MSFICFVYCLYSENNCTIYVHVRMWTRSRFLPGDLRAVATPPPPQLYFRMVFIFILFFFREKMPGRGCVFRTRILNLRVNISCPCLHTHRQRATLACASLVLYVRIISLRVRAVGITNLDFDLWRTSM